MGFSRLTDYKLHYCLRFVASMLEQRKESEPEEEQEQGRLSTPACEAAPASEIATAYGSSKDSFHELMSRLLWCSTGRLCAAPPHHTRLRLRHCLRAPFNVSAMCCLTGAPRGREVPPAHGGPGAAGRLRQPAPRDQAVHPGVRKLAANREFDLPAAPMSLNPRLLPLHWGLAKMWRNMHSKSQRVCAVCHNCHAERSVTQATVGQAAAELAHVWRVRLLPPGLVWLPPASLSPQLVHSVTRHPSTESVAGLKTRNIAKCCTSAVGKLNARCGATARRTALRRTMASATGDCCGTAPMSRSLQR